MLQNYEGKFDRTNKETWKNLGNFNTLLWEIDRTFSDRPKITKALQDVYDTVNKFDVMGL